MRANGILNQIKIKTVVDVIYSQIKAGDMSADISQTL